MAQVVWRTEVMEVKTSPVLHRLCFQSKNLYNRAMFLFKQFYKKTCKNMSYQQLDRKLKTEVCYRILPAQTAQQTLKILTRNWKSFFQALKEYRINSNEFLGKPRQPKYKTKNGQQVAIFTNQQVKIRNKQIIFPKKVPFKLKTRLSDFIQLKEVRIIPRGCGYSVEIVYSKLIPDGEVYGENIGAIDLGLKNLITYVDNIGSRQIVIKDEGKGIKSIIQFYLKEVKRIQNIYVNQQYTTLQNQKRLRYGSRFHQLRNTKRLKVKNWVHQMSKALVEHWIKTKIHRVFIGYNPKWKQQIRLHKKTTQMFVIIPFEKIIQCLKYKAEENGISVETIEENYTSKCSFLDNEYPQKKTSYMGKRVKRGLYKSASGIYINSDVNGAYNILLKGNPQALPPRSVGGVGGYVVYPLRWSFEQ